MINAAYPCECRPRSPKVKDGICMQCGGPIPVPIHKVKSVKTEPKRVEVKVPVVQESIEEFLTGPKTKTMVGLTEQTLKHAQELVTGGKYGSVSDYIRTLIARDIRKGAK